MGKGSFLLYDADLKGLEFLTDAQTGKLFKALAKYRLEGTLQSPGSNPAVNILLQQMIEHITINEDKYKAICEKRSEAINKRWAKEKKTPKNIQKNTNEYDCIEMNTSEYIYDNDIDNDIDIDNVIDIDNDTVACGAKKENKRNNYYNKKKPFAYEGEPSFDADAFTRKAIGLKFEKKEKAT